MYTIKVVSKGGSDEKVFPCSHYNVTRFTGSAEQALGGYSGEGIRIMLFPSGHQIHLPDHGDVAYVTEGGKTVDTYKWPERGSD